MIADSIIGPNKETEAIGDGEYFTLRSRNEVHCVGTHMKAAIMVKYKFLVCVELGSEAPAPGFQEGDSILDSLEKSFIVIGG